MSRCMVTKVFDAKTEVRCNRNRHDDQDHDFVIPLSANYLTQIRYARDALDKAYALAQDSRYKTQAETECLDAINLANAAIVNMRKDA